MATNVEPYKHLGLILTLNPERRRLRCWGEATFARKHRKKKKKKTALTLPWGHWVHIFHNVHFTMWIKNKLKHKQEPKDPSPQYKAGTSHVALWNDTRWPSKASSCVRPQRQGWPSPAFQQQSRENLPVPITSPTSSSLCSAMKILPMTCIFIHIFFLWYGKR